jgi:hypothetical protein
MSHLEQLLTLPQRALATDGPHGINVVPVSVVAIEGEAIILHDFFMGKTVANIKENPAVALTAWDGPWGLQIKGHATYEVSGESFTHAVAAMARDYPDRIVRGIIRIVPQTVYTVAPGPEAGKLLP